MWHWFRCSYCGNLYGRFRGLRIGAPCAHGTKISLIGIWSPN